MNKNSILKGTLILTIAGLITRILGFLYRIYLSNMIGAKNMGIYQLVFPVYGICFTLYASGIQTAISKLVAAVNGPYYHSYKQSFRILKIGICLSVSISFSLSIFVNQFASFIANTLILEPDCTESLKILSYIFPFCGITACINGYYYGLKKTAVPALTQLLEQIVRVAFVYLIALYFGKNNLTITCEIAVVGLVCGEIASNLFNLSSLFIGHIRLKYKKEGLRLDDLPRKDSDKMDIPLFSPLLKLAVPLTGNRLITSILSTVEAILIPSMLKKSGMSSEEALSIYGILTGMSIPFIMFPSTITNSLSVLLLPAVSEAQAADNQPLIQETTSVTIKYSLLLGLYSTTIFIILGDSLGTYFFHNPLAGNFLTILAWLCPFLYITTTLGSIINGLGKAHYTLLNTTTGLSVRILFILYLVPKMGIKGYLIGLLVSQLCICLLDYMAVSRSIKIPFEAGKWIIKPGLLLCIIGFLLMKAYEYLVQYTEISHLLLMISVCVILLLGYLILLIKERIINKVDFR